MSEPTHDNLGENNQMSKSWLKWAHRHPAVLLVGAVVVAILVLPKARKLTRVGKVAMRGEDNPASEEAPLFI